MFSVVLIFLFGIIAGITDSIGNGTFIVSFRHNIQYAMHASNLFVVFSVVLVFIFDITGSNTDIFIGVTREDGVGTGDGICGTGECPVEGEGNGDAVDTADDTFICVTCVNIRDSNFDGDGVGCTVAE